MKDTSPKPLCSVDGCSRPQWARGWCTLHCNRWYRTGDTGPAQPHPRGSRSVVTLEEKFAQHADTSGGPDACWPWTGPQLGDFGYGALCAEGARHPAHRWALERKLGRTLGPDEEARHDCDNPPCVNPAHLRPGSRQDNIDDMMSRGRNVPPLMARLNAAKTHCKRGHELAGANLYVNPKGERQCRRCAADRMARYRAARAGLAS